MDIQKYFPDLTPLQIEQFSVLERLYPQWNEKINVISRADIEHLFVRHILHSLSIAKFNLIESSENILDVGTGGGFPGIPLAVMYPEKKFTLIDSIGKKITVASSIAQAAGLKNVTAKQIKSNMLNERFDTITSRAVTAFPNFLKQTKNNLEKNEKSKIVYLKGGDFEDEISAVKSKCKIYNITEIFDDEFFETKKIIVYTPFINTVK
ncbi:MAG: 16S rRNA (guanine(527)-N(7))-methyltransferase RsmG [Bacteroidales bacterium]|jgi:16S rRNA (guanine527-N7)-methyltransferase|nr:16S rRNA (guanine(527)-N(7))-methyltransferase RsmG [Bacteroidales bacterium]